MVCKVCRIHDFPWKREAKVKGKKRKKIWNASRICVSSLRRGHANLLCIVPILVYVGPKPLQEVGALSSLL